ncbi:hypothetical protein [Ferruginibacter sp.]
MNQSLQLSDIELKMFEEVFEVMSKYKNSRTFGLQLVHSHFKINQNETLFETHNKQNRSLQVNTVKISDFKKLPLATAWNRKKDGSIVISMFCCDGDDDGGYGNHGGDE